MTTLAKYTRNMVDCGTIDVIKRKYEGTEYYVDILKKVCLHLEWQALERHGK